MATYIGLSLKEARAALAETVKTGTRHDGTKVHPKVLSALGSLNKSMEDPELREAGHYVVCWSGGCFWIVDHVPIPPPMDIPQENQ
jgi:hypothetical protein